MAGTLNDSILAFTGGPTVNDGLLAFYRSGGAPLSASLPDAEHYWLSIQTGRPVNNVIPREDLWMQFLSTFSGALNDRLLQYWGGLSDGNPVNIFQPPGSPASAGCWFEPSDPTIGSATMWQDSIGTIPVTAVEQPVGLILDKHVADGPELVANGTFDVDTTGWTAANGVLSIVSGRLRLTSNTTGLNVGASYVLNGLTIGAQYAFRYSVFRGTALGATRVRTATGPGVDLGVVSNISPTADVVGGICLFTATATTMYVGILMVTASNGMFVELDNVSVRQSPGNHATQATAASRPTLSARLNLFEQTESASNAYWNKNNAPTISPAFGSVNGIPADKIGTTIAGSGFFKGAFFPNVAIGAVITASVFIAHVSGATPGWIVRLEGAAFPLLPVGTINPVTGVVTPGGGATVTSQAVTGGFRVTVTGTATVAGAVNVVFYSAAAGAQECLMTGMQAEYSSPASRYQKVLTSTSYDTVGFPHYLRFDGSDDSMVTPSIDMTGADTWVAFLGVLKVSDAITGTIVELSTSTTTNNGAFVMLGPNTNAANTFQSGSKGTVQSNVITGGFPAPYAATVTGVGKISSDLNLLRVNGAQTSAATDQGTGNMGNYPIFIGRRNQTTNPFNGNLYCLVCSGSNPSAAQITATESYVRSKMGR